jgi:predicted nucleic acid-binding protein
MIHLTSNFAADTNVFVYSHDKRDPVKRAIAYDIVKDKPLVSAQVISEYVNVMRREHRELSKCERLRLCASSLEDCTIHPVHVSTLLLADRVIVRYDLSTFDAIIVASCLEAGCDVLYTEDIPGTDWIFDQLLIVNPFPVD